MKKSTPELYEHLEETAQQQAALGTVERIRLIKAGMWINFDYVQRALKRMEDLVDHPPISRMPNMLLVGPPFSGKTSLLEYFMSKHQPDLNPDSEVTNCPVVMIDAPPKPDISDFYSRILDALMSPYKPTSPPHEKYAQIKRLFKQMQVRVLIIDEIHHLIAGSLNRQREFRNAIKSLGNETKACMIAAGIDEAYNAMAADAQMSSRFLPFNLPESWPLGDDLGQLLATLENRTPLRMASQLTEPEMLIAFESMSEGVLGDICDLFKVAAIEAIESGTERITIKQLSKLDWVPPSKRKRYSSRM